MKRDTKFNYGVLFVGLALPIVADYFLGKACGIVAAILVAAAGVIFLVSGHTHREVGDPPLSHRKKMAAFAIGGAAIALSIFGLREVYNREYGNKGAVALLSSQSVPSIPAQTLVSNQQQSSSSVSQRITHPTSTDKRTKNQQPNPDKETPPIVSTSGSNSPAIGTINAPGGIPIINNSGIVTSPTVNNFGPPVPILHTTDVEQPGPTSDGHARVAVKFYADGPWQPGSIAILCDRDCEGDTACALLGVNPGTRYGHATDNTKLAVFDFHREFPGGEWCTLVVRSTDQLPIKIVEIRPLNIVNQTPRQP